jgi:hypothetical protein
VTVAYERLEAAVPGGALLALDTSATLSYLAGFRAERSPASLAWLFDGRISTDATPGGDVHDHGRRAAESARSRPALMRFATAEGFLPLLR